MKEFLSKAMWQPGITHEVIGRMAAMFWRVLKSYEVQVTEETVASSIVICSVPLRGNTLDWMAYGMEEILSDL